MRLIAPKSADFYAGNLPTGNEVGDGSGSAAENCGHLALGNQLSPFMVGGFSYFHLHQPIQPCLVVLCGELLNSSHSRLRSKSLANTFRAAFKSRISSLRISASVGDFRALTLCLVHLAAWAVCSGRPLWRAI